jgi:hypothetical protein
MTFTGLKTNDERTFFVLVDDWLKRDRFVFLF